MSSSGNRGKAGAVAGAILAASLPAARPSEAQTAIAPGTAPCVLSSDGSLYTLRITNLSGITVLAPNRTSGELSTIYNAAARGLVSVAGDYNTCFGSDDTVSDDSDSAGDGGDHGGDDGGGN